MNISKHTNSDCEDRSCICDVDSFYRFFQENCQFHHDKNGNYTRYYVSPRWGDGYMEQIRLHSGLELCITSLQLKRSISLQYHLCNAPLELHYMLEGNVYHHEKSAGDMNLSEGKLSVFFRPEMEGTMTLVAGRKIVFITIMVSDLLLSQLLESSQSYAAIQEIRNDDLMIEQMKPHYPIAEVRTIFGQILSCPFTSVGKTIFFQGKAAELIAHIWEQVAAYSQKEERISLYPYESTALERAKELLENNLADSLSVPAIANAVGLNVQKFKTGFKQCYRLTPHQYLIRCRMIQAHELMHAHGYSVTEAAAAVGYTNVSYFGRVFRAYYGQTPKHFRFGL